MFKSCSFGNHEYGLPRLVEPGVTAEECMRCLHVKRQAAPFANMKPAEPAETPGIATKLATVVGGASRFTRVLRARSTPQLNEVGTRAA